MKINKLTKVGILLLFGISLFLWNCQKDETIEHTHESIENTDSKLFRVSINDLIKNDEIFSKLSENYLADKIARKGVSSKSHSNDLIITSDTINVIEKENYKSYTIRIKRNGYEYDTENLIIEQKDGVESAYILSYDFDNEWVANRLKGTYNSPKGKIYYSEFDTSSINHKSVSRTSQTCQYITIIITVPCPCVGHYNSCSCHTQAQDYSLTQEFCTGGGGNDNDFGEPLDFDNGNEGDFGGGGGGAPSPSDSNDNSETQSNLEDMAEFVEFKLNALITRLELNTEQAIWVGENVEESLDIYDYVAKENSWSNEAKEFAKDFISSSTANIVNLTNEEIESFFNYNQDYKNRMSASERAIFDSMSKFEQISYLVNAQKATWTAEDLFPNSLYNGKGDAFRHAYWNALNVILLGDSLAASLATAHEDKPSGYPNDFKEKQMDLFNNQVGRTKSNWFSDGYSSLTESILDAITNGELRFLSNLLGGGSSGRATNSSSLTPTN